jgi:hypothetical protein
LETVFEAIPDGADLSAAFADCFLVCQTPEAGYAIGDIARAFGIGGRANPSPNLFHDAGVLRVRLMVAGESFWVSHKATGAATNISNANWKAKLRVWLAEEMTA